MMCCEIYQRYVDATGATPTEYRYYISIAPSEFSISSKVNREKQLATGVFFSF
eukprot:UN16878